MQPRNNKIDHPCEKDKQKEIKFATQREILFTLKKIDKKLDGVHDYLRQIYLKR